MRKITIIVIILFGLHTVSQAQDFYFGLKSGWKKETYTMTESNGSVKLFMGSLFPSAQFQFKTIFKDRLELGTGLGYYNYGLQIGMKTEGVKGEDSYTRSGSIPLYHSMSIPLTIGYALPIVAGLSVKAIAGLDFDFYFNFAGGSFGPATSYIDENGDVISVPRDYPYRIVFIDRYKAKFNVLLLNQLSLEYLTKKNFSVSLFAAYHTGLREVRDDACLVNFSETEQMVVQIFSRGSYWHFGLELGYRFGKKEKL